MAKTFLLGNNNIESNRSGLSPTTDVSTKFTCSVSGLLNMIRLYISANGGNIKCAIYSDSSGVPNTLLGETEIKSSSSASGTWLELKLATPLNITSGIVYHLSFINSADTTDQFAYNTGTTNQRHSRVISYPTFPSTYGTPTVNSAQTWSIYGEYDSSLDISPSKFLALF